LSGSPYCGRSRGARASNIRAPADHLGRVIGLELTAGKRGGAPVAQALFSH
jgi:hypothetical protein